MWGQGSGEAGLGGYLSLPDSPCNTLQICGLLLSLWLILPAQSPELPDARVFHR